MVGVDLGIVVVLIVVVVGVVGMEGFLVVRFVGVELMSVSLWLELFLEVCCNCC